MTRNQQSAIGHQIPPSRNPCTNPDPTAASRLFPNPLFAGHSIWNNRIYNSDCSLWVTVATIARNQPDVHRWAGQSPAGPDRVSAEHVHDANVFVEDRFPPTCAEDPLVPLVAAVSLKHADLPSARTSATEM